MAKDWDLEAGDVALDFVNTLEWRNADEKVEQLTTYTELLDWSVAAGLLSPKASEPLLALAARDSPRASQALGQARSLREVLYRIFAAHLHNRRPARTDLARLNLALTEAQQHMRIRWTGEKGFSWEWSKEGEVLDRPMWAIVRAASDLLTSSEIGRIGECADDRGCAYLFIDQSRNRSRRWCSMDSCGNRAKARRHYRRSRATAR